MTVSLLHVKIYMETDVWKNYKMRVNVISRPRSTRDHRPYKGSIETIFLRELNVRILFLSARTVKRQVSVI